MVALVLLLLQSTAPVLAPSGEQDALPSLIAGQGAPTVTVPRFESSATVDGHLDEPEWAHAARLGGFSQYRPVDGRPAEEETEVRIWYSPTAIYFGIIAHDHDPSAIRATMADRDNLDNEDTVTIYLDTFHDQRRAFFFTMNALGVQQDGMQTETGFSAGSLQGQGSLADKNPDFQFESKGRLTEEGYIVEVRIPFTSLRYPGNGPQSWGLQLSRIVQRTGYQDTWTDVRRAGESFLAQEGAIDGLHDLERGIVSEVQPVITASENGARDAAGEPFVREPVAFKPGVNARFSTTNLTFDSTVNPDFSQVEADAAQVTVNQRFALFYPEKRPFFLEGIDMFATPNQLVYTRQIVSPIAGAKLTGKVGALNVAYLAMKDDESEGGALFNIARLRRDVGVDSTAGITFTDRSAAGEFNRVFAFDTRTIFKKLYYYQVQVGEAWTAHADGSRASSPMWMAELDRTGRAFGFNYKVTGIGTAFEEQAGYIPRNNIIQATLYDRYSWYGTKGAWLDTFSSHWNTSRIWRYDRPGDGPIEGSDAFPFQFGWRGGWSLSLTFQRVFWHLQPEQYATYQTIAQGAPVAYAPHLEVTGYTQDVTFKTPVFRTFDGQFEVTHGPVAIFAEGTQGHETDVTSTLDGRPTRSVRLQATLTYSRIVRDRDGSEFAQTVIPRAKVEFQATRAIFFRMIAQYTSQRQAVLLDATGEPLLVGGVFSSAQSSNGLRLDWLASYKPTPFTVAFFGYGSSLAAGQTLSLEHLQRTSDGFFLKVAYQFRR